MLPAGLPAFVLTATLIELTPGPNMAWLALVAATEGRRPGYAAVAGVALGLALIGIAAAFGLAALIAATPALYQALRWGGVLYLIWLAWDGWRDAGDGAGSGDGDITLARAFRRGLVTNLLNPKAAIFYVAVLPGFTDPGAPVLGETLILTAAYVAVATLIHAGIVTLAGSANALLGDPGRSRMIRRALSASLALVALWFFWSSRAA
ncbi:MAG TPA: LysE family translocator [Albidovulum sp.]|uniref:LysE family translocator n=1 Tax=Albidovulum sp. TaxID=1872424 RepID=UPI002CD9E16B|nr:LysE family translocator [Albidovulum sp.]